jgi:hypothetical protein
MLLMLGNFPSQGKRASQQTRGKAFLGWNPQKEESPILETHFMYDIILFPDSRSWGLSAHRALAPAASGIPQMR